MFRPESARHQVQLIDERLARLRAQKDRLLARASRAERRRETRQKIVIGGTILAAIESGGVPSLESRPDLERWLNERLTRPHDRAVFALDAPPR